MAGFLTLTLWAYTPSMKLLQWLSVGFQICSFHRAAVGFNWWKGMAVSSEAVEELHLILY